MLKSVARLLRQFGYDSLLFPSAEAFLNHNDFGKAACVLLDINLGDISGIDLRHRLKATNASAGHLHDWKRHAAVREAALESGCLAYLTKPFSAGSLIEPIKRASAGRS
jgi:FixJ family two-component response regulator